MISPRVHPLRRHLITAALAGISLLLASTATQGQNNRKSPARGCVIQHPAQPLPQEKVAPPLAGHDSPDLETVLSRATHYVEEYEAQLGNLIGEEVYAQNQAAVKQNLALLLCSRSTCLSKQQRTESEFAILHLGREWVGFREVNCLDGEAVRRDTEDFQKVIGQSPSAVLKALENIANESASYNIGVVRRTTNLPTFALRILLTGNTHRFQFTKTGETIIGGIRTWNVGFRETQGPTMIQDGDNHDEFADGTLWIEPETGRVLKTEVNVAGTGQATIPSIGTAAKPITITLSFRAQTVVFYKDSPTLGMLVPATMEERYDTDGVRTLDCRADYFNFHRFEVDTHLDFGSPVSPDNRKSAPAPGSGLRPAGSPLREIL